MNADRTRLSRRVLAALVLAYLVTRVIRLIWFPPFFDEGYYASEAYTAWVDPSQAFISLADAKGPLQTWLAMGVLTLHVSPLVAVRVVSLLGGLATLLAVVGIGNRVAGARAAAAAGAVYVALPFALAHDPMGLVDPLTTGCMAVALYLQLRLAAEPSLRWGLLLGVATGLALLTKANAFFVLAALPLSVVLLDWRAEGRPERLRRWALGAGTSVVVAVAIQSVMRLSDRYDQIGDVKEAYSSYHPVGDALRHLWRYVSDNGPLGGALLGYLTVPLILAALAGLRWLVHEGRGRAALVLAAWFAGPVAMAFVLAPSPFPRYMLAAVPAFAVAAGAGSAWLLSELVARRGAVSPRLAVTAGVLVLAGFAVARDAQMLAFPSTSGYAGWDVRQYVTDWSSGSDLDRIADQLEAAAPAGRVVVATTGVPPYNLAVLLGKPRLIEGTGPGLIASSAVVEDGGTTFRLTPQSDPLIRAATLGVYDQTLTDYVPPELTRSRVVYAYKRPGNGTTVVVVRLSLPSTARG